METSAAVLGKDFVELPHSLGDEKSFPLPKEALSSPNEKSAADELFAAPLESVASKSSVKPEGEAQTVLQWLS